MLRFLIFSFLLFSFFSCSTLSKAMKEGELESTKSLTTIPIIKNKRLNFVKVKIEGEDYTFFIDTGAPNIVSEELSEKLNLKKVKKMKTGDSQGNSEKTVYVRLPEMWVGDFRFTNTVAMIADLSGTPGIQCLGIDGIIGSNLMQKAIWQFDFEQKEVHIARTKADLPHPVDELEAIPFSMNTFKTPKFTMEIGPLVSKRVKLDLGSGNGIDASKKGFRLLLEQDPTMQYLTRLGSSNYGIFGSEQKLDSTYHSNSNVVVIGGQSFEQQNIRFQNNNRSTKIGMKFWDHFLLTVNWFEQKMYIRQQTPLADTAYVNFGFSPIHRDTALFIAAMEVGGPAERAGMEIGDRILRIDGRDLTKVTIPQWCKWIEFGFEELKKEEVEIELITSKGKTKTVRLRKEELLVSD